MSEVGDRIAEIVFEEIDKMESENLFRKKLGDLINCYSMENGSNTPDFILAQFLIHCLQAFDSVVNQRNDWYR